MKINKFIFTYLFAFLIISLLLRILGFILIDYHILLGIYIALPGISLVYSGIYRRHPVTLFFGTLIFLAGLILVLITNALIINPSRVIYPSLFLIPGTGFLAIYLQDQKKNLSLVISLILLFAGTGIVYFTGNLSIQRLIAVAEEIIIDYWILFVILGVVIFLSFREELKQ